MKKNWKLIPSEIYPHMAKIKTPNGLSTLFDKEDARLMCAAPELLSILQNILNAHDSKNNGAYMSEARLCSYFAELARAAIAKATGII